MLESSVCSARKFWFAFRSGYASATANSLPSAAMNGPSAAACAAGEPVAPAADARARVTSSNTSRSCVA